MKSSDETSKCPFQFIHNYLFFLSQYVFNEKLPRKILFYLKTSDKKFLVTYNMKKTNSLMKGSINKNDF
jgi:hypothetical protein